MPAIVGASHAILLPLLYLLSLGVVIQSARHHENLFPLSLTRSPPLDLVTQPQYAKENN